MDGSLPPAPRWPPLPDLERLVEDLTATAPLFEECAARGRRLHPSMSMLALFGDRFLGEDARDHSAAALRARPWQLASIVTQPQLTVLEGSVRLSYFLAAIATAGAGATGRRGGDWAAALAWLVLYGIPAHRLWSFVPAWFVGDLLRPSLRRGGQALSPLLLLLLQECPDLAAALPPPTDSGFAAGFAAWLAAVGIARFGLFWLCTHAQLAQARLAGTTEASPPGDLVWPDNTAPLPPQAPDAGRADRWQPAPEPTGLGAYGGFGPAFPAVRVDLDAAGGGTGAAWRRCAGDPAADAAAAAPALELTALSGPAALPAGWLPPGVMLLELVLPPALAPLVWLQVELDGQPLGLCPGTALRPGRPRHLLVPHGTRAAAPRLDVRLGCRPEGFALAARSGGVFARLLGLHFWRLR